MRAYNKILTLLLALFFVTGLCLSPAAAAGQDNLDKILAELQLPSARGDLVARLDRGQLVYGLPNQVPGNEWKQAETSWQKDNKIDQGHPGNQEPRHLGFTPNGTDKFSNDWFPVDKAPIAPVERNMIFEPWYKKMCSQNLKYSDYTWGVIGASLANYHEIVGFPGNQNSFIYNPSLTGDFPSQIQNYFKVLDEPRPGVTGAIKHWHLRNGGRYYDTITIRWDVLPDFVVEGIDPGTEKAEPGKTYQGKLIVKAVADGSFASDPITKGLYDILYGDTIKLTKDYSIPAALAVNGSLVELKGQSQMSGLKNVYSLENISDNTYSIGFTWSLPANYSLTYVDLSAEINSTVNKIIPGAAINSLEMTEMTTVNNFKTLRLPVNQVNLKVVNITISPDPGEPGVQATGAITIQNESDRPLTATQTQWRVRTADGKVFSEDIYTTDLGPEESDTFTINFTPQVAGNYSVAAMINPDAKNPPDEINFKTGDWPGDNRKEVLYRVVGENLWAEIIKQDIEAEKGSSATVTARIHNDKGRLLTTRLVWKVNGSIVKDITNFDIIGTMDNSLTFTMPNKDAVVTVEVNPDRNRPVNEDSYSDNKASCTVAAIDPEADNQGNVTIIAPDEWPAMKPFNFTVKVEDYLPYGKDKEGNKESKKYNITCSTNGQGKRTLEYNPFDPTGGVQKTEPVVKSWTQNYTEDSGSYEKSFTYTFPGTGMVGASWTTVVLRADVTRAGSANKTVKIKPIPVTSPDLQLTR